MQLPSDIDITSKLKTYRVSFYETIEDGLLGNINNSDFLIIDRSLKDIYNFSKFENKIIWLEAKEETKSFENLVPVIQNLLELGIKRNSRIVAIGGGIIQDTVSFISSILFRGIEWIFFPTTLLSQGDSCIGGKTSINFGKYKNQLGNFNPPNKVSICFEFLKTITDKEYRSGIGEMCHFYFVSGRSDVDFFTSKYKGAINKVPQDLIDVVERTLLIKRGFVENDEFDKKERLLLNYGHSFGHALESLTNYSIPHGIAVCHGMKISNFISKFYSFLGQKEYLEMHEILQTICEGQSQVKKIDVKKFFNALKKDKKNINNNPRVVLTNGIGKMFLKEITLTDDLEEKLEKYFLEIF